MKPKKTMIILGTILRAEKQVMTDKQDKTKTSEMFNLVVADATKPTQFRTTTQFITFATPDKLKAAFGTVDVDALADEKITIAAADLAPFNGFIKLKGVIAKGHQSGEALMRLTAEAEVAKAADAKKPKAAPEPAK